MYRRLWIIALLLCAGCTQLQEKAIEKHNRDAAWWAWGSASKAYRANGVPHGLRKHFGRGFREGYYQVASGGDGRLPLLPPTCYWGPDYQNEAGQAAIFAWFRGFEDGAIAAEQAGVGRWSQLPSSYVPVNPPYDPSRQIYVPSETIPLGMPHIDAFVPPSEMLEQVPAAPSSPKLEVGPRPSLRRSEEIDFSPALHPAPNNDGTVPAKPVQPKASPDASKLDLAPNSLLDERPDPIEPISFEIAHSPTVPAYMPEFSPLELAAQRASTPATLARLFGPPGMSLDDQSVANLTTPKPTPPQRAQAQAAPRSGKELFPSPTDQ